MRTVKKLLTAAAVSGALVLSFAPGASANPDGGYVSGSGYVYDDWNDEGTVSLNSHTSSNATCLWQMVLYAEGYGDHTSVDGIFGTNTYNRTRSLQGRWGLSVDGIAGNHSWARAGQNLTASVALGDGKYRMVYSGSLFSFYVYRDANGHHSFHEPTGELRTAGYNYRTCT